MTSDDYGDHLKKAIAGDADAFGELYRIFLDRIYRFTYYLVRDEFSAEDITQNTFIKAWNNLRNFSIEKGTFQSYLFTIARNLVIDSQRKKKEFSLEAGFGKDVSDEGSLEDAVWKSEVNEKLKEVLADLPEEDRQLLILRYFEEMKFNEIARVLGESSGGIRVKIHRLMKKMKEKLKDKI